MKFQEAIESAFRQYANFDGRARRSEYWYFALFLFLVSLVISTVCAPIGGPRLVYVLNTLFTVAIFLPSLALVFRRLHDTGRTGLWFLLAFVPLGALVLLAFCCMDSQPGENEYGPNPKETDVVSWQ